MSELVQAGASAAEIATYLDELPAPRRVEEVRSVRGRLVGRLYELVAGTAPLGLEDIVPESVPAGATVAFEGRNSLPAAVSSFQKRFTRTADGVVFGYNHALTSRATGPGYFVVSLADEGHPGELLFDYTLPPPFEPAGWPPYVPNDRMLSRLVFMNMHDFVRRVARGVVVGAAFKLGVPQDAWFSLTSPR
jgi:hypothetical protein